MRVRPDCPPTPACADCGAPHGPAVTCEGKAIDCRRVPRHAHGRLRGRGRLRSRTSGSECAMSTNDDNEPRVEPRPLAILTTMGANGTGLAAIHPFTITSRA